ncbi:MAG: hypothetical protein ACFE0O_01470 [Opitutales bacterium]
MDETTPTFDLFTTGLTHEDRLIRKACLDYFAEQPGLSLTRSA